jgi:hypothetical protein
MSMRIISQSGCLDVSYECSDFEKTPREGPSSTIERMAPEEDDNLLMAEYWTEAARDAAWNEMHDAYAGGCRIFQFPADENGGEENENPCVSK